MDTQNQRKQKPEVTKEPISQEKFEQFQNFGNNLNTRVSPPPCINNNPPSVGNNPTDTTNMATQPRRTKVLMTLTLTYKNLIVFA